VAFNGLGTGLNTQAIINAYLSLDAGPLTDLENQQGKLNTQLSAFQTLQSQLTKLQSAADAIATPGAFSGDVSASSSNSAIATARTGAGATAGAATFSVVQLATANTLVSSGTVAATSNVVATGPLLVAAGGDGIGISSVAGSGLALGSHEIEVSQASRAASVAGSSTLASSTVIDATNDQLSVTLNANAQSYTIASGTYTPSQLTSAIETASAGALTASVDSSGHLVLASANQGSTASLVIGAGTADAPLGLSNGQSSTGTDGIITVDGTDNVIDTIDATGTTPVTLTSGTGGTISASLTASGLHLGSIKAQNVSVGNGSLASVVSAINAAAVGVSAQAIEVAPNAFALEVSSNATGASNNVSIDSSAFSGSALGNLTTTTAGQDAIVDLGGSGGYAISSSSNTVTGLLPGVSISLLETSAAPVTISVNPDGAKAASTVQSFVDAANQVLGTISGDIAFDPATNHAGPLNGNYALETLAQSILAEIGTAIGNSSAIDSATPGSAAGLSLNANGTIAFDASAFAGDFEQNPTSVAALFSAGGSFSAAAPASSGDVQLVYANDLSQAGEYALNITQSATQALDRGSATFSSPSSSVGAPETYSVTVASTTANYAFNAGDTIASIVAGLNTAFAQQGLALSAQAVTTSGSTAVEITSNDYGSTQSFSVSASGSDVLGLSSPSAFVGQDVAGTINGSPATGVGQVLSASPTDPVLAGLGLIVATPGISSPTAIGNYLYAPGIAQSIATIAAQANVANVGLVPATITSIQNTLSGVGTEITTEQQLLSQQQAALTEEYNNLDTTLSSMQSESSFLKNALGGSSANLLSALSTSQTASQG
jgi:flagellar hook-associated protein 2